jgi:hypothetical protein
MSYPYPYPYHPPPGWPPFSGGYHLHPQPLPQPQPQPPHPVIYTTPTAPYWPPPPPPYYPGVVLSRIESIQQQPRDQDPNYACIPSHCLQCEKPLNLLQRLSTGLCQKHSKHRVSWEAYIKEAMLGAGIPEPSCCNDQAFHSKRPDFGWELADRIILLEIDEDSHSRHPPHKELEKLLSTIPSISAGKPLLVIRFNPSQPSVPRFHSCIATLISLLRVVLFDKDYPAASLQPPPIVNVLYMFYQKQKHQQENNHISAARLEKHSIHVVDAMQ